MLVADLLSNSHCLSSKKAKVVVRVVFLCEFLDAQQQIFFIFQANITHTNHIMWTMGMDFMYQYAETWFRNIDKLIHYVNQVSFH